MSGGLDIEGVLAGHVDTGDWPIICTCGLSAYLDADTNLGDLHRSHLDDEIRAELSRWLGSDEAYLSVSDEIIAAVGPGHAVATDAALSALAALVAPSRVPGEET